MLRRAPSRLALRALQSHVSFRPFTCSSCLSNAQFPALLLSRSRSRPRRASFTSHRVRKFSQPSPVTNVGAPRVIRPRLKALHDGLSILGRDGANYVNLSQLQLALRGLEAEDATIRIAVLGVNGQRGARRLVRALLADPLGAEEEWEHALMAMDDNGKGVLLRYGEHFAIEDQHPLLVTLTIPSPFLLEYRLEILIGQTDGAGGKSLERSESLQNLLVPSLDTPTSPGHLSRMKYPVHKTLVYGEGMEGARAVFGLTEPSTESTEQPIMGVVNVNWRADGSEVSPTTGVIAVNLPGAEAAVAVFRESVENATAYEHGWLDSNMNHILPFLSTASASESQPLKPTLRSLITNILRDTTASLPAEQVKALDSSSTNPANQSLNTIITSWSVASHTELRDSLANAFHSRSWRRLAWWKLPWRVDDIALVLGEVVQRAYLPQSEKGIIYVSGCIHEAGFSSRRGIPAEPEIQAQKFGAPTDQQLHDMISAAKILEEYQPWPVHLTNSRAKVLASIPSLQADAQSLLLRSFSTTALTSTVAALAYVSVSTTSVYEVGAIASLGFVWSARLLQKHWERIKAEWVTSVEQEGRRALVEAERWARGAVEEGNRKKEEIEDEIGERADSRRVRESVERCRGLVEELSGEARSGS